jgi:hypothetical protein
VQALFGSSLVIDYVAETQAAAITEAGRYQQEAY